MKNAARGIVTELWKGWLMPGMLLIFMFLTFSQHWIAEKSKARVSGLVHILAQLPFSVVDPAVDRMCVFHPDGSRYLIFPPLPAEGATNITVRHYTGGDVGMLRIAADGDQILSFEVLDAKWR